MSQALADPLSLFYPTPCRGREPLGEYYESEGQEESDVESEWDSSHIPRLRPQSPETQNEPPEAPLSPERWEPVSETQAQEGISQVALGELALLLTSTGECSEYGHGEDGAEELAVELQNYTCILHDAADENWEREKEGYAYILIEAVLEGLESEDKRARVYSVGARKRTFCDEEEGVREYDGNKRRRVVGDKKCLTGRRAR